MRRGCKAQAIDVRYRVDDGYSLEWNVNVPVLLEGRPASLARRPRSRQGHMQRERERERESHPLLACTGPVASRYGNVAGRSRGRTRPSPRPPPS